MESLKKKEKIDILIELWQTTIETQQHFNDMLMKVRNFGFILIAALLGATGFSLRSGYEINNIPVAAFLLAFGGLLWSLIYFLEMKWYTPLLIGSVMTGMEIEDELKNEFGKEILPDSKHFLLTNSIKQTSGEVYLWENFHFWKMDSKSRGNFFHRSLIAILFILSALVAFTSNGKSPTESETKGEKIVATYQNNGTPLSHIQFF